MFKIINKNSRMFKSVKKQIDSLYDDRYDVILDFFLNKYELYFVETNNKLFDYNIVIENNYLVLKNK